METLSSIASHTWSMIAEMGPFLLIGLAISALLHRLLKPTWIERLMGQRNLRSILWGSVVGVPMPLCSCGVIPVTMSLHSKGASKGAAVSFLTSTPQTGVDSFFATYGMLGPVFALYKIVVSFLSGILVGLATELFDKSEDGNANTATQNAPAAPQPKLKESLRYGFYTMPGDLAPALIIGFLLAGLVSSLAPADLLSNLPGGALSAILMATVLSVPFYICSTGSIPLALALVQSGLPISAALVLLIAGPATNIATITTMRKVLGGRSTAIYVAGIILTTWIAAGAYHLFLDDGTLGNGAMSHDMQLPLWKHLGGIALLALLLFPHLKARFASPSPIPHNRQPTNSVHTLSIRGMTCSHCESSVKNGLAALPGVQVLSVDKSTSSATIQAEPFDEAAIREITSSLGFDYQGSQ